MLPRGFVNSRWDPNGAPLGFFEFAVGPQWVHHWGFVNSRWEPSGAPLGFLNSQCYPSGALLGFCEFAVGPVVHPAIL